MMPRDIIIIVVVVDGALPRAHRLFLQFVLFEQ